LADASLAEAGSDRPPSAQHRGLALEIPSARVCGGRNRRRFQRLDGALARLSHLRHWLATARRFAQRGVCARQASTADPQLLNNGDAKTRNGDFAGFATLLLPRSAVARGEFGSGDVPLRRTGGQIERLRASRTSTSLNNGRRQFARNGWLPRQLFRTRLGRTRLILSGPYTKKSTGDKFQNP
jgi:hypothetical protein